MEDIVGIKVALKGGATRGALAWGRVTDAVDDEWLIRAYIRSQSPVQRENIKEVTVCESIRELTACKYFFEGLFDFAARGIPYGSGYDEWRKKKSQEYDEGIGDFYDVGVIDAETRSIADQ